MPVKGMKHSNTSGNSQTRREKSATNQKSDRSPISKFAILSAAIVALVATIYYVAIGSGISQNLSDSEAVSGNPAFDVVDIPGKGKGLVAMRDIRQGELLIREKPLILVPSSTNMSPVKLLRDRLDGLTPGQRDAYFSLSYVTPGRKPVSVNDDDVVLAILQTNGISAGNNVGLFPKTARLNHGCSAAFNAVYLWRPQEGHLVVHAIKPIKEGQELLTTYTDTKRPRHARQAYLKSNYGFTCSCSVCSLPESDSAASDERLGKMSSLYQVLGTWDSNEIDGIRASQIAKEIWNLGEEEGYWSERGRLAADIVHVAAAHSDERGVRAWANLAQTWYAIELGNDSTQALEAQSLFNNPQSHFAWGSKRPQLIESPPQTA